MLNLKTVRDYFFGIFLMPWIWAWGYYILFSSFAYSYLHSSNFESIQLKVRTEKLIDVDIYQTWLLLSFSLVANYTISFFLPEKYKKTDMLLFSVIVFQLIIVAVLSVPYLREMLAST